MWLEGWDKRIKLDIDYTNKIGASVTWFPITIFLKSGNGNTTKVFDEVGANSKKIAITKSDGITELKGEIEQWDSGNKLGVIHTSITGWVINADTSIYLYYDNNHADNPNIGTTPGASPASDVWDNYFVAVWHLGEASEIRYDSKGSNNLTDVNTVLQGDGKIGKAADFEADNQEALTIDDNAALSMGDIDFTFECWMKPESINLWQRLISKDIGLPNREYLLALNSSNKFVFGVPGQTLVTTTNTASTATWYYVAAWHDPTGNEVGVQKDLDTPDTMSWETGFSDTTAGFALGSQQLNHTDGLIDEVRISKTLRSAAWRKATYYSGDDSLLTYGEEEFYTPRHGAINFQDPAIV